MTFEEWYIKTYPTGNVRPLIDIKGIAENAWHAATAQSAGLIAALRADNERLQSNFEKLATAVDGIKELHPSKYTNDDVNKLLWSCVEVFRTLGKIQSQRPRNNNHNARSARGKH